MTDDEHLLSLQRAGFSLRRIAGMANLTEAEATIRLCKLGAIPRKLRTPRAEPLAEPPAKLNRRPAKPKEPPEEKHCGNPVKGVTTVPTRGKINPTLSAMQILGQRAGENAHGFTYDGQPIGSFELIRKANRVLKDAGQPQMDACWEWIIHD